MNRTIINKEMFTMTIVAFLTLSIVLAAVSLVMPMASAAAATITLAPSQSISGSSVNVTGTGFTANSAVDVEFGAEVAITGELVHPTGSGLGPYTVTLANRPIKPGSFAMHVDVNGGLASYDLAENGAGVLTSEFTGFGSGIINYVTGKLTVYTNTEPSGYTLVHIAGYTTYGNDVTPSAGITTNISGSFTANIVVPIVSNGTYAITAIDASGNRASSNLSVSTQPIPEVISIGAVVLLSSFAMLVGSRYLGKRPKDLKV